MMETMISRLHSLPGLSGEAGSLAFVVFCGVVVAAQTALFPITPFSIFAGLTFGFWHGAGVVLLAKMLSALVNFSLSRWLARDWAQRMAVRFPLIQGMNEAISEDGFKLAVLLRLCPIPFGIASYSYGLTKLSIPAYLAATFVAILMPTLTMVGLGASMHEGLMASGARSHNPWQTVLTGAGILASLLVARRLSTIAMKRVAERRSSIS